MSKASETSCSSSSTLATCSLRLTSLTRSKLSFKSNLTGAIKWLPLSVIDLQRKKRYQESSCLKIKSCHQTNFKCKRLSKNALISSTKTRSVRSTETCIRIQTYCMKLPMMCMLKQLLEQAWTWVLVEVITPSVESTKESSQLTIESQR